jgi:hypothetical protein
MPENQEPDYVAAARRAAKQLQTVLQDEGLGFSPDFADQGCSVQGWRIIVAAALLHQLCDGVIGAVSRGGQAIAEKDAIVLGLRAFVMMFGANITVSEEAVRFDA